MTDSKNVIVLWDQTIKLLIGYPEFKVFLASLPVFLLELYGQPLGSLNKECFKVDWTHSQGYLIHLINLVMIHK